MSLPTFSELLASLRLSSPAEFETDSPAGEPLPVAPSTSASSVLQTNCIFSPDFPSPASSPNLTRHTRCISSSSSISSSSISSSSASTKHLPSNSPSISIPDIITSDLPISVSSPLSDSDAASSPSNSRLSRHSTRSINRFTPYLGASKTVHIRRCSLPDDLQDAAKPELPNRPSTVSPRLLVSDLQLSLEDVDTDVVVHRDASSPLPSGSPPTPPPPPLPHSPPPDPSELMHIDIGNRPDVPISSFARRKTPKSSPTLTNFRQRRHFSSLSPVLLPTLLPGLSAISLPDTENVLCDYSPTKLASPDDGPRVVRQHGLRLSSYRSFYISSSSSSSSSRSRTTIGTSCV